MPERLRDALGVAAAMLLGVAVFFVFCGWWVLLPTNIAWLDFADRAMHQLGWMFYRDTPWGVPPGASPRLGIELASSIALVDGLPLLAIPFKLIAPWLPQPFQYFGYWLLLSFVLQSLFAWRIARELGAGRYVSLAATAFVLITPAFLFRIPMHLALSSHWVLLAGLFLYVRRVPPSLWMWPLLAGLTAAIHATLLAMVLGLGLASWLQRLWLRRIGLVDAILEPALAAAAVVCVLWTVGFFGAGTYGSYGYGAYKLNLLWPFIRYGWSQIFPNLPHTNYDYEGLSFLGIGILALLLVAIGSGTVLRLRAALTRLWLPLLLILSGMMLFAFSKTISLGPFDILHIPMPGFMETLGAAFRSTGRFVWPLLYLITIGAVVLVGQRFRLAIALPVLLAAFTAQAVDSAPGWRPFAANMAKPSALWKTPLISPFWERAAAAGYNRVRAIPVRGALGKDWKPFGYYAVTHGMDTDDVYLSRVDEAKLEAARAQASKVLETGDFEPKTIYILDVGAALSASHQSNPQDLLAIVDHRIVFLRDGAALAEGLDIRSLDLAD